MLIALSSGKLNVETERLSELTYFTASKMSTVISKYMLQWFHGSSNITVPLLLDLLLLHTLAHRMCTEMTVCPFRVQTLRVMHVSTFPWGSSLAQP